jgi:hypothetical protein
VVQKKIAKIESKELEENTRRHRVRDAQFSAMREHIEE